MLSPNNARLSVRPTCASAKLGSAADFGLLVVEVDRLLRVERVSSLLGVQSFARPRQRCLDGEPARPFDLTVHRTAAPASVKFRRGPVVRPGDGWKAALGRRRHSPAQTGRPQTVFSRLCDLDGGTAAAAVGGARALKSRPR